MEKWLILGRGQKIYKLSLDQLVEQGAGKTGKPLHDGSMAKRQKIQEKELLMAQERTI